MVCYHIMWYFFPFYHGIAMESFIHHSLFVRVFALTFTPSSSLFSNSIKWHSILSVLLLLLFCFKFNFYRYLMSFLAEPCWHTSYTHRWWSHSLSLCVLGSFFRLSSFYFYFCSLIIETIHTERLCGSTRAENKAFLFKGYALPSVWYVHNNCFWLYLDRNHVIDLLCCFGYDQFSTSLSSLLLVVAVVSNLHR